MRVLCVTYCYPPLQYPATMCYVKLVAGLKAHGVDVEVMTIDPDTFYFPGGKSVDPSMMTIVPDGVKNHRIRSWESNPLVVRLRENQLTHRLLSRFFEPRKREWTFPALQYLKRMDLSGYDAIVTCSQPHCNHLIGLEVKKLTGKPWIAYLSDPWTDNVYASFPTKTIFTHNLRLETAVMNGADRVFFTSPEILELVMGKYPAELRRKCGILPHSFVPAWYRQGVAAPKEHGNRVRILHTGHFYGPRSPQPLFQAIEEVERSDHKGKLDVLLCGGMKPEDKDYVRERGLASVVTLAGTIPYLESLATMQWADYLLLVDAPLRNTRESVFLPSKLVDYLGSGKPIIGITPAEGASARVLRETGHLVCDIADKTGIVNALRRACEGRLGVMPNAAVSAAYRMDQVTRIMRDALEELL